MKNKIVLGLVGVLIIVGGVVGYTSANYYCYDTSITGYTEQSIGTVCVTSGYILPPSPLNTGQVCTIAGYVDPSSIDYNQYCVSNGYIQSGSIIPTKLHFVNGDKMILSGQDYIVQIPLTGERIITGSKMNYIQYIGELSGAVVNTCTIDYSQLENSTIRGIAMGGAMILLLVVLLYLLKGLFVKLWK